MEDLESQEKVKMIKTVSEHISKVYRIESSQYSELMNHLNDNDEIVTEISPIFVAGKMTSRMFVTTKSNSL